MNKQEQDRKLLEERVHNAIMSMPYDMQYIHGDRRVSVSARFLEQAILKAIEPA